MSPTRLDILTDGLTALARVIMTARSDRDAAAIVHQLRAMGPAQRSDVDSIAEAARERLRQQHEAGDALWAEPDSTGPMESKGFVTKLRCGKCDRQIGQCGCTLIGGPLGEGD